MTIHRVVNYISGCLLFSLELVRFIIDLTHKLLDVYILVMATSSVKADSSHTSNEQQVGRLKNSTRIDAKKSNTSSNLGKKEKSIPLKP